MKRGTVTIAVLFALATIAASRPLAQQQVPSVAEFHLVEATVQEMQLALQTGLVTSGQLVQMYLARIAAYEDAGPAVNAFIHLNPTALQDARQLDAERHAGRTRSPLYGIPVALKDIIDTRDMPTTGGSLTLAGSIPPNDAFITRKLH